MIVLASTYALSTSQAIAAVSDATVTLTSSSSISVSGQSVTFTATVAGVPGLTPTGTVTFLDDGSPIGTGPLAGTVALNATGQASLPTSSLSIGGHGITAMYSGDANYAWSASDPFIQVINPAIAWITLTSSSSSSVYGQSVTFTVTVADELGVVPNKEVILTTDGTPATIGTVTLDAMGRGILTTSSLSTDVTSITADFSGDANYSPASKSIMHVVHPAETMTTLISSPSSPVYGQPVTFSATVSVVSPGTGTPTGTVDFYDGSTLLGTSTISGGIGTFTGIATFTTPSLLLSGGTHTITATYMGDSSHSVSTSSPLTQAVNPSPTNMGVSSSLNPSLYGQSVTFTAAVTGISGCTPTGTVTFYNGSTLLGTGTLNSTGIAALATSSLPAGMNQITATYSGDVNYSASTSSTLQQMVEAPTLPASGPVETVDEGSMSDDVAVYQNGMLAGSTTDVTPTATVTPCVSPTITVAPSPTPTSTPTPVPSATASAGQNGGFPMWLVLVALGVVVVVAAGYMFLRRQ